jgi:hypothetical protein
MNNAGSALLNNVVNNASANIKNTNSNSSYFLIGSILLLCLLGYLLYQKDTLLTSIRGEEPVPRDWREIERREKHQEKQEKKHKSYGENWCFVGEDVTGRWCVKVPRPDACSSERLFSSRPDCELVTASPMPLGLIAKKGAEMKPLLAAAHTK